MNGVFALILIFLQLYITIAASQFFENAGRSYGTKIWKVNLKSDSSLKQFQLTTNGFSSEDAYIVLLTSKLNGTMQWNIHLWLGQRTTTNKIEMAENYALELGQELENAAQYYREVEGYESPLFKSYFPRVYKPTENDLQEKRKLIMIKGNKYLVQVPLKLSSLNEKACFLLILDYYEDVYIYCGKYTNHLEKTRTLNISKNIFKCAPRGPKGKVKNVLSLSEDDPNASSLLEFLGGSFEDVEKINVTEEQDKYIENFDENRKLEKCVFKVVYENENVNVKVEGCEYPVTYDQMTCYLLDTKSTSGLLVVLGTKTDLKQKKKIFQETEKYIIEKSYPLWIPVIVDNTGNGPVEGKI